MFVVLFVCVVSFLILVFVLCLFFLFFFFFMFGFERDRRAPSVGRMWRSRRWPYFARVVGRMSVRRSIHLRAYSASVMRLARDPSLRLAVCQLRRIRIGVCVLPSLERAGDHSPADSGPDVVDGYRVLSSSANALAALPPSENLPETPSGMTLDPLPARFGRGLAISAHAVNDLSHDAVSVRGGCACHYPHRLVLA